LKFPDSKQKAIREGSEIVGVLLKYTSEGDYDSNVFPLDSETFCIYCLYDKHGFNGDGMEYNYVLYVPSRIREKYIENGGTNPNTGDPFWEYMNDYLNMTIVDIKNNWSSVIEMLCGMTECPNVDVFYNDYFNIIQTFGSSCNIDNIKVFKNNENEEQIVILYDYNIPDKMIPSAYDSPSGGIFRISGSALNSGSGTIAYIIPLEKIKYDQKITTSLKLTDTNKTIVGIRIFGDPNMLNKDIIPSLAIIIQ
jgi:hypothetical protein